MGRFKLGSTVVSAFAPNMVEFNMHAESGTVTRLGEHYADIVTTDNVDVDVDVENADANTVNQD
jgi:hypothetical protein